jgi:hypothetical protein
MSLSTKKDSVLFETFLKPSKILKMIANRRDFKEGKIDFLRGAVLVLSGQGFITESTYKRYHRLFSNIRNNKTSFRILK